MIPTLLIGDHILVSKLAYGIQWPSDCKFQVSFPPVNCYASHALIEFGKPQRGDIIVFISPLDGRDFIKRCVAVAGDTVEMRNKVFYLNGKAQQESYVRHEDRNTLPPGTAGRDFMAPYVVPPEHLFMMGDNRDNSNDSRFWGPVAMSLVKGRAMFLYWSWDPERGWPRWTRLLRPIH